MSAVYLPELSAHKAARLFAGDAKTDERDAMVIAKTALGIPDTVMTQIRSSDRPRLRACLPL